MTIPAIPAGAQLGGAGTAENQALLNAPVAPVVPQIPATPTYQAPVAAGTPPVPVFNQTSGQWELPPTSVPVGSPLIPAAQTPQVPIPVPTPETPVVVEEVAKPIAGGESYLESTINHFSNEIGVDSEEIMNSIEKALEHGDIGLINVTNLGNLTPEQAQRATQLAQLAYQHTQQEIATMENAVHAVAGGKAQWEASIAAFNASANDEAKGYVAYLADHARNAKAAAEYVTNYVRQAGLTTQVTQAPIQGGTGAPVAAGLSKQEYSNGIHSLEVRFQQRQISQGQYDVEMADLDYRRSVGRRAGK